MSFATIVLFLRVLWLRDWVASFLLCTAYFQARVFIDSHLNLMAFIGYVLAIAALTLRVVWLLDWMAITTLLSFAYDFIADVRSGNLVGGDHTEQQKIRTMNQAREIVREVYKNLN